MLKSLLKTLQSWSVFAFRTSQGKLPGPAAFVGLSASIFLPVLWTCGFAGCVTLNLAKMQFRPIGRRHVVVGAACGSSLVLQMVPNSPQDRSRHWF